MVDDRQGDVRAAFHLERLFWQPVEGRLVEKDGRGCSCEQWQGMREGRAVASAGGGWGWEAPKVVGRDAPVCKLASLLGGWTGGPQAVGLRCGCDVSLETMGWALCRFGGNHEDCSTMAASWPPS